MLQRIHAHDRVRYARVFVEESGGRVGLTVFGQALLVFLNAYLNPKSAQHQSKLGVDMVLRYAHRVTVHSLYGMGAAGYASSFIFVSLIGPIWGWHGADTCALLFSPLLLFFCLPPPPPLARSLPSSSRLLSSLRTANAPSHRGTMPGTTTKQPCGCGWRWSAAGEAGHWRPQWRCVRIRCSHALTPAPP